MITKFFTYILEKSSLTKLGIPNEVMKDIQINYEIPSNTQWEEISYKKDLKNELKKDEKSIYIEVSEQHIKVILNDYLTYKEQKYKFDSSGWGNYEIGQIIDKTYTQTLKDILTKSKIYKFQSDDIISEPIIKRKIKKELEDFDNKTDEFKISIIRNFNNIVKRIYDKKYSIVMKKIADNMSSIKPNVNADELLKFLTDNKKLAELAKEYEVSKNDDDKLGLKKLEKQYNSLPIFDEFLINFEVLYTDKYNYRVTIKDLLDTFGLMQTQTAFLYYLYTGKIKDLRIQKFETQQYNDPSTYSNSPSDTTNIITHCSSCGSEIENFDKLITDKPLCDDCTGDEGKEQYPRNKNSWRWS
ncbi:hypothetical protein M0Q50_04010 [bacterium]|jgi:hypothetical protein|nr:hypothetical protein [bacterium]